MPCPCLCLTDTQGFSCPWYNYLKPSCCCRHVPQPVLLFPCRLQKREHELQEKAARASAALPGIEASLAKARARTAAIAQKVEGLRQRRQRLQVGFLGKEVHLGDGPSTPAGPSNDGAVLRQDWSLTWCIS